MPKISDSCNVATFIFNVISQFEELFLVHPLPPDTLYLSAWGCSIVQRPGWIFAFDLGVAVI
jgi:hypothetical protein